MNVCTHILQKGNNKGEPCRKPLLQKDPRGLYCSIHSPQYDENGVYYQRTRGKSVVAPFSAAPVLQRTVPHRPVVPLHPTALSRAATPRRARVAAAPVTPAESGDESEPEPVWEDAREAVEFRGSASTRSATTSASSSSARRMRVELGESRRDRHSLPEAVNRVLAMYDARFTEYDARLREEAEVTARLSRTTEAITAKNEALSREVTDLRLTVVDMAAREEARSADIQEKLTELLSRMGPGRYP